MSALLPNGLCTGESLRPEEILIVMRTKIVLGERLKRVPMPDEQATSADPDMLAHLQFLLTARAGAQTFAVDASFEPHGGHRAFTSITSVVTPMKTGNVCMGEMLGANVSPAIDSKAEGTSTHLARL